MENLFSRSKYSNMLASYNKKILETNKQLLEILINLPASSRENIKQPLKDLIKINKKIENLKNNTKIK